MHLLRNRLKRFMSNEHKIRTVLLETAPSHPCILVAAIVCFVMLTLQVLHFHD